MKNLTLMLWRDEHGFLVSAELVLIATIVVLAMIVGLSEVAYGVNEELEDIGSAFGAVNQSYRYAGVSGHKAALGGGKFHDHYDFCDGQADLVCNTPIHGEW